MHTILHNIKKYITDFGCKTSERDHSEESERKIGR
jgi:hypothetical protein